MIPGLYHTQIRGVTNWVVDLRRVGHGRRFFEDKSEAQRFATQKTQEIRDYGREALNLTHKDRVAFLRAQDRLTEAGATIDEAVTFFLKHHHGLKHKPLRDAWAEYWDAKSRAKRRETYVQRVKSTVKLFLEWAGDTHAIEHVHEVGRDVVTEWLHANGWAPVTQSHYLGTMSDFFAWCLQRAWTSANPCAGVERPSVDDKPPGILTIAECETLLKRLQEPEHCALTAIVAVQLFAGLRPAEAYRLRNDDIGDGYIEVTAIKSKTRQRRIVKIEPVLQAWLDLGGELPPKNYWRRYKRLRYAWTVVNAKGKKAWRPIVNWSHDCLRHSFVSYHLAAFKSAARTAVEAGHTESILFRHYRELVRPRDAQRFWELWPT